MLDNRRKEEAHALAQQILYILTLTKEIYQYCRYLHLPETEFEREYLQHSQHFRFISHILWRAAVIELAKLYSDKKSDKYRLKHFISKFEKSGEYSMAGISESTVDKWQNFLSTNESVIREVRRMRDTIYSHTDSPEKRKEPEGISFDQFKILIDFAERVLREFYSIILDSHLDVRTPLFDHTKFDLIRILAEEKRNRLAELFKKR